MPTIPAKRGRAAVRRGFHDANVHGHDIRLVPERRQNNHILLATGPIIASNLW